MLVNFLVSGKPLQLPNPFGLLDVPHYLNMFITHEVLEHSS